MNQTGGAARLQKKREPGAVLARLTARVVVAVTVVAAMLTYNSGVAHATNYSGANGSTANCAVGFTGDVNMQDANPHTFYYGTGDSRVQYYQETARLNELEPTSVNTTYQSYVDSYTDVVVYAQHYTTYCNQVWWNTSSGYGLVGLTSCVSLTGDGSGRCEKHEVRYNENYTDINTDQNMQTLTCHEMGHTVGLRHPVNEDGDSCMVSGQTTNTHYTEHDVAHLNGGSQTLYPNQQLNCNQSMKSWDGHYRATMQSDGNFVIYDTGNNAVQWATNRFHNGCNAYLVMQGDGNVVIYYPNGVGGVSVLCAFGTNGHANSILRLQNDANLVVIAPGTNPIWSWKGGGTCH